MNKTVRCAETEREFDRKRFARMAQTAHRRQQIPAFSGVLRFVPDERDGQNSKTGIEREIELKRAQTTN